MAQRAEFGLVWRSEHAHQDGVGKASGRWSESEGCLGQAEMMAEAVCSSSYHDGWMVPVCKPALEVFEVFPLGCWYCNGGAKGPQADDQVCV